MADMNDFFSKVMESTDESIYNLAENVTRKTIAKTTIILSILIIAILLIIYFFLYNKLVHPLPPKEELFGLFNFSAIRYKLFHSGLIPYAILFTFVFGIVRLFVIWFLKYNPLTYLSERDIVLRDAIDKGSDNELVMALNYQIKNNQLGYFGKRIYALRHRLSKDQDLSAVQELKNDLLEIEEENLALSFTAVSWCEIALPLLGFLGTVVGIGKAMGGIGEGVNNLFAGAELQEVLPAINLGFQGMGVAFDTTFLGLAALIVLGIFHVYLKTALASKLAESRKLFSDAISLWTKEVGITLSIELGFKELKEAFRSAEMRSTLFRESIRDAIEHVILEGEGEGFQSIRKVLFKPLVEFSSVGIQLARSSISNVNDRLEHTNWTFAALGLPISRSMLGIAAVDTGVGNNHQLCHFTIDGECEGELIQTEYRFKKIFLSSNSNINRMLAHTQNDEYISGIIDIENNYCQFEPLHDSDNIEAVLPVLWEGKDAAIIIRQDNLNWKAFLYMFHSDEENEINLPSESSDFRYDRDLWSVHKASATIFAGITIGRGLNEQRRIMIISLQKDLENLSPPYPELNLPSSLKPKKLIGIENNRILIIDEEGKLHCWDTNRSHPYKIQNPSWASDPPANKIINGSAGWIAVARQNRLTMWRVYRRGMLNEYEQDTDTVGLDISAVNQESFSVAPDGRYLLALTANSISTWEFPKYVTDEI